MGFSAVSVVRGPGELAAMVIDVTKLTFTTRFQSREFIEQAWFITSVTLMPTILVSIPFGAVISLQVGNLTSQLGAQSFAGATAVLAVVREAAPIAAALSSPGRRAPPSAPTWAPARSARRSTRWRCSASTRSPASSCPACSRPSSSA